ncbi:MAG: ASPIC/UnbV domain-containing protein [Acidobacteriota bacterium]
MSAVAHIDEYKTGRFYTDEYRGNMSWNGYENNNLLRNEGHRDDGSLYFSDVAMALGADDQQDARGIAIADFDNDGDLDLAINHNIGDHDKEGLADAVLLRNDIGDRRSWLAVELEGTQSNRDAVGATVSVEAGADRQLRLLSAGSSYASQHSQRLYFGLGEHDRVDRITVRWPSGELQVIEHVAARQLLRVVEGEVDIAGRTLVAGVLGGRAVSTTEPVALRVAAGDQILAGQHGDGSDVASP